MDALPCRVLAWDYTSLADAYVTRPDYAEAAIDQVTAITGLSHGHRVLDLGAGTGHLSIMLAARGLHVLAVEPNSAMRAHGSCRTATLGRVEWHDGVMEATGQPAGSVSACTYGSSFGVVDRLETLREAARVLKDNGWFVCLFNHRVLEDPLQREIEAFIKWHIPGYSYGSRREDQSRVITESGLFGPVLTIEAPVTHMRDVDEWIEAWRSHATLQRQAGARFSEIVDGIATIVKGTCTGRVEVPYVTRGWLAPRLPRPSAAPPA